MNEAAEKNSPQNGGATAFFNTDQYTEPPKSKNAVQGNFDGLERLQKIANENGDAKRQAAAVYLQYQENSRAAGELITKIEKGIAAGDRLPDLLLMALEVIGRITGDYTLHQRAEKNITAIYGDGLLERSALDLEQERTAERLKRLRAAAEQTEDADTLARISHAIAEHQKRQNHITERMNTPAT